MPNTSEEDSLRHAQHRTGRAPNVIVDCDNSGVWAFHRHILPHADSEHGIIGIVTALIVEK